MSCTSHVKVLISMGEVNKMTRQKEKSQTKKIRPALTPEAQENRMIALSMRLAEQQLLDGTASSQVITHFLKLGSSKEKEEREHRKKEMELLEAKTENIKASQMNEEIARNAIEAMKRYSGNAEEDYDDKYEDF